MNWVEFQSTTLGYGNQVVLENFDLTIPVGQSIGMVGPNGAGKTTLLKAMLGLLRPLQGKVTWQSGDPTKVGYVPQRTQLDELFPFTVGEIVEMGLYGSLSPFHIPGTAHLEKVRQALEKVGLSEMNAKPFRELSGGQKQRVLLARALVSDPNTLVLDEPTRGLDLGQTRAILSLLDLLGLENNLTLIIVSHILSDILEHTRFLVLIHEKQLAYQGPTREFTQEILGRIYGLNSVKTLSTSDAKEA